jgi:type II secretory pathway component PulF
MTRFAYTARDTAGHAVNGTLTAPSLTAASRQLRQEGKFVVKLRPSSGQANNDGPVAAGDKGLPEGLGDVAPQAASGPKKSGARGIARKDVIFLTTQLAVMTDTGVPLADALDAIRQQGSSSALSVMLEDIATRVKSGEEFSAALAEHSRVFPPMYVAMVRAAEVSGTLGVMLDRVADYLVEEYETRKKVIGALIYPCVMMGFALAVTVFLMAFVLPRFAEIYSGHQAALPAPTQMLMNISHVFTHQWYFLLAGTVALVVGARMLLRSPAGQYWWFDTKLKIPLIGRMLHTLYTVRCLRTLSTLIGTGVAMLEAVVITRQIVGHGPFARLWDDVGVALQQGHQLSEPLFDSKLIPRAVSQMIAAGERTGKLAEVMDRVAMFCDRELKDQIRTCTAMIEPIMIAAMGGIIGTVVMALLLPIFTISQVMTSGTK